MLVKRLRRWFNIQPTLAERIVFSGTGDASQKPEGRQEDEAFLCLIPVNCIKLPDSLDDCLPEIVLFVICLRSSHLHYMGGGLGRGGGGGGGLAPLCLAVG